MKMMIIIKKRSRREAEQTNERANSQTNQPHSNTPPEYSFELKIIKQVGNDSNKPQKPAKEIKNNKKNHARKWKKEEEEEVKEPQAHRTYKQRHRA